MSLSFQTLSYPIRVAEVLYAAFSLVRSPQPHTLPTTTDSPEQELPLESSEKGEFLEQSLSGLLAYRLALDLNAN